MVLLLHLILQIMARSEQRILAAAGRLFARFGFNKASTRAIASEAGVTEKSVYRIFGSKSGLFDRVKQRIAIPVGFLTRMEIALHNKDFEQAIRGFAHEYLGAFSQERTLAMLRLQLDISRVEALELFGDSCERIHSILSSRIHTAQRAGAARTFDAEAAARSLSRLLLGEAVMVAFSAEPSESSTELLNSFVDVWLAAFIVPKSRGNGQRLLSRTP